MIQSKAIAILTEIANMKKGCAPSAGYMEELIIMKQETGFEWLDDVSDEIRDIYCEKCRCITEHEVNPITTDGCERLVFGWTCTECGNCDEIYE